MPSALSGRGLFATRALERGRVVAFYPAHALGDAQRRFEDDCDGKFGGRDHKPYRVSLPASPGLLAWDADDLWIDVNPLASSAFSAGWHAHLVNDGATCASACSEADVLDYYARVPSASNCCLVSFGDTPFLCYVVTKDVASGAELFGSYGHEYWCAYHLGRVPTYGAAVAEAEVAWQESAREWRRRVQDEYAEEIAAMSTLVQRAVYDDSPGPEERSLRVRTGLTLRVSRSTEGDVGTEEGGSAEGAS